MAPLHAGDRVAINPFSLEFVLPQAAPDDLPSAATIETRNKFEGSIATLPISDLIQLLNATQQSGLLVLTDADDRQANLVFIDGEISQAHYDGRSGEQAIFALLRERRGRFEFTKTDRTPVSSRTAHQPGPTMAGAPPDVPGDRQIRRKTQSLLMEGARLIDETPAPATAAMHPSGATTRDSSTTPDLRAFGNLLD
jgi:hypothetical protein